MAGCEEDRHRVYTKLIITRFVIYVHEVLLILERRCVGGGLGGQKGGGGSKGRVGGAGGERVRAREESRRGGTGEPVREGGYEGEGNGHLLHWTQATLCYEILKFNISENIKETHSPARLLQRPAQATRLPGCCDLHHRGLTLFTTLWY